MKKTYDMYVEEINNAKDDNELSNIYDEVNMIQDAFVNKSLKLKIAKRSDDLSNNIVNPTVSKSIKNDEEIKISKTQLKKIGVITVFGVAILATGIVLGKKSSSDNISARNVPYESSTSIEVSETVPTVADTYESLEEATIESTDDFSIETVEEESEDLNEFATTVESVDAEENGPYDYDAQEREERNNTPYTKQPSVPMPEYIADEDSFLNNFQLSADEWDEYYNLPEDYKKNFRIISQAYPQVIGDLIDNYMNYFAAKADDDYIIGQADFINFGQLTMIYPDAFPTGGLPDITYYSTKEEAQSYRDSMLSSMTK